MYVANTLLSAVLWCFKAKLKNENIYKKKYGALWKLVMKNQRNYNYGKIYQINATASAFYWKIYHNCSPPPSSTFGEEVSKWQHKEGVETQYGIREGPMMMRKGGALTVTRRKTNILKRAWSGNNRDFQLLLSIVIIALLLPMISNWQHFEFIGKKTIFLNKQLRVLGLVY